MSTGGCYFDTSAKLVGPSNSQTPEGSLEKGYAFVGTPDEVVGQVAHMRQLYGEYEPSPQVTFGGITDADALRTVELLARGVMPAFAVADCRTDATFAA
jgi:hypothetical protein